jgi:hypothetical protein
MRHRENVKRLIQSARFAHLIALLWIALLAFAVLGPAILHSWMIGPYDLLSRWNLTARSGVLLRGSYVNSDPITQMIPWTDLNWTQVHHGQLPLWNPYSGLGLPLVFNWQSASFSVPSLVSYVFPLRDAYTASVITTLLIAGTGAYVLGRVLRLGFFGAVTTATVFELCGPLIAWLGYPQAQVMAWGGWLFAAAILVVRGRRRVPSITLLALVVAETVYAGHPETAFVMMAALVIFVVVYVGSRALPDRWGFRDGSVVRPSLDLVAGVVVGGALAAPLLLPALQLTKNSVRTTSSLFSDVPAHALLYFVFSSFDGVPVPGNLAFGTAYFYDETSAYVGVTALALAIVAIVVGVRRHRPATFAFVVVAVIMTAMNFARPLTRAADHLPLIGAVDWSRAIMAACLALAALAGMGMDAVARNGRAQWVTRTLLAAFVGFGVFLAGAWVFWRNSGLPTFARSLDAHVRSESFIWPTISVLVGVVAVLLLVWRWRSVRLALASLLVCEALFLIVSGYVQISSSTSGPAPTPAVVALTRATGHGIVGIGPTSPPGDCQLGISAEDNIFYGVQEIDLYDPIVPTAYFATWTKTFGTVAGNPEYDSFCPGITSVAQARLLGASYVVEMAGHPGPPGSTLVERFHVPNPNPATDVLARPPGDEVLYRIPGASRASLTPLTPSGHIPGDLAPGRPLTVQMSNPRTWNLTTNATTPQVLRLRLTDVPGWHATIDGRPLRLETFFGFMLQARIPRGRHQIELTYWPVAFTAGLVIALLAVLLLAGALLVDHRRHTADNESANALSPDPRDHLG